MLPSRLWNISIKAMKYFHQHNEIFPSRWWNISPTIVKYFRFSWIDSGGSDWWDGILALQYQVIIVIIVIIISTIIISSSVRMMMIMTMTLSAHQWRGVIRPWWCGSRMEVLTPSTGQLHHPQLHHHQHHHHVHHHPNIKMRMMMTIDLVKLNVVCKQTFSGERLTLISNSPHYNFSPLTGRSGFAFC